MREPLPIDAVLDQVVEGARGAGAVVVVAPTGSGKTTRVPSALLDGGLGPVWLVVPRRIAARAAARRIASERGTTVGGEVGYEVRFERKLSAATRILAMTDGILMRRIAEDPFLEGVGAIVFDEFHERRLATDLGLALARRAQVDLGQPVRLVVASATLDPAPVAAFLGRGEDAPAPVVQSAGRSFEVAIRHRPARSGESLEAQVRAALEEHVDSSLGDALVFLPGKGEIERTARELARGSIGAERELLELHGEQAPELQDAVFGASRRPKLILATNVAESSVTLPGLAAVIDSGLARVARHDPGVGLDRLELTRISRASADQRAGRAGRTGPGLCVRLWSPAEQRSMPEREAPEVQRLELSGPLLALLDLGEAEMDAFGWFERPSQVALDAALELLERLGATRGGAITERGRALAQLPVSPRLGTLLIEAAEAGDVRRAALAAAILSDRDPFRRRGEGQRDAADSDLVADVDELRAFLGGRDARAGAGLAPGAARAVERTARQLARLVEGRAAGRPAPDALERAILAAWPDRLARRRVRGEPRALMSGGKGVELARSSRVTEAEYFVCVELLSGMRAPGREPLVTRASAFDPAWLQERLVELRSELTYDASRDRVVARSVRAVGDFVLEAHEGPVADALAAEAVLADAASAEVERALDLGREELAAFAARVACLRDWCPELDLPALDSDFWRSLLPDLVVGRRSFAELARAPVLDFARARLSPEQARALDREAPERLQVPSGSQLRVQYEPGRPPVLAARIQELFGMRSTPRVGRGRITVLMHLLAPNGRPQQVTDDLESFWSGTYFEVRKELKRRYPKHDWPDDPLTATPRRRPGRGRSGRGDAGR